MTAVGVGRLLAGGGLASARGQVDRAWDAAIAGWVRALVTGADRGDGAAPRSRSAGARSDHPRARPRLPVAGTPEGEQAQAGMLAEWELDQGATGTRK